MAQRLIGRQAEVARMAKLLAPGRKPSFVAVSGEPGIGKSRLLAAFAEVAHDSGVPTIKGRATEFERSVPFGLWLDALAHTGRHAGASTPLAEAREALLGGAAPAGVGIERHRGHRRVRALLERAAEPAGLLVLLDDAQWADGGSVELLDHLVRHPPDAHVVICIVHRTGSLPGMLIRSLGAMNPPPERWTLGPMSGADLDDWLSAEPSRPRREKLAAASGGNPLFLEILSEIDGEVDMRDIPAIVDRADVTTGLQRLIAAELEHLDAVPRLVAQGLAVGGDGAGSALVAAVCELDQATVEAALDLLVGRRVLRSDLGFRHPLIRAAAYHMAGPAWRIAAHRRAAGHLDAHGGSLIQRAGHMEHALQPGDLDGARLLAAAAQMTLDTVPTTAIRWVRAALKALPAEPRHDPLRNELLLIMAEALRTTGRLDKSRALLRDLLRADHDQHDHVVELLAATERALGLLPEARAVLLSELTRAEAEAGPSVRAELMVELAATELLDGRWDAGGERAAQALRLMDASTRRGISAVAYTLLAVSKLYRCEFREGCRLLDRAAAVTDALSEPELHSDLSIIAPLAWAEFLVDRHDDALRHVDRGMRVARRSGRQDVIPLMSVVRVASRARLGQVAEAMNDGYEAEDITQYVGGPDLVTFVRAALSRPLLWRAGPERATPLVDELLTGHAVRSAWWRGIVDSTLAEVLLSLERMEACRRLLAARVPKDPVGFGPHAPSTFAMRARAEAAAGDLNAAAEWHGRAVAVAASGAPPAQQGSVLRAEAAIALARGDHQRAASTASAAVDIFAATGLMVEEGQARMLLAEIKARLGDVRGGRQEVGHARELFATCGASWLAGQAGRQQRRMSMRQARRPGGGAAELSHRERQIAELVAQGLTNRQIAQQLYLSPRTVESHVAQAFQKLGVTTRAALAHLLSGAQRR
ncbi:ATP-binding protein [Nonomuraea angiospora]|uniref:ATP-binding protein n=1 Tax=Nonomuraea angiospora TaxID=46172 RepID=UPI00379F9F4A